MIELSPPQPNSDAPSTVFIGDDALMIRCAELARRAGHEVRCIVTQAPKIAQWARDHDISVCLERDFVSTLQEVERVHGLHWLFSVANLRRVPDDALSLVECGAVNFHDGPLPRYGGVHAPAWAIMAMEREHGVTWHRMTTEMDAGDILVQKSISIDPEDTSLTLNLKCFEAGAETFAQLLDSIAKGQIPSHGHSLDRATYHGKKDRFPAAAILDWNEPAAALAATVRALDFGNYRNTLGAAKVVFPKEVFIVRRARSARDGARQGAGNVIAVDDSGIAIATTDGNVILEELLTLHGERIDVLAAAERGGVRTGTSLPQLSPAEIQAVERLDLDAALHESFWVERFLRAEPLVVPPHIESDRSPSYNARGGWQWLDVESLGQRPNEPEISFAIVAAWLGHVSCKATFDVGVLLPPLESPVAAKCFTNVVPIRVELDPKPLPGFATRLRDTVDEAIRAGCACRDLFARVPELRGARLSFPIVMTRLDGVDDAVVPPADCRLLFAIDSAGSIRLGYDSSFIDIASLETVKDQLRALLDSASTATVDKLSLISTHDRANGRAAVRGASVELDDTATIVSRFKSQASRSPEVVAIVAADRQLTYAQLDQESDCVAHALRELDVQRDTPVGVCLERDASLVVAVLGILKAGAAYLPLDPTYPADRLRFMVVDSAAPVILTSGATARYAPPTSARMLAIDAARLASGGSTDAVAPRPDSLAYVIYTSGSTGTPKGVMVEHRNVMSFFAAMDQELGVDPKRWLAATSLSFDISVLELLWPLTHGSTVVVHDGGSGHAETTSRLAFSLFYFSAQERGHGLEKYRLLLDGARFADAHGFSAVWTPERHFHEFGGLFPNPAVTGAALATITERVQIRAGSVVLPLHHPARVAEEWSVVDNLSNGRVALSFASGWRPDDFLLRPEAYKDAKRKMIEAVATVRSLWKGETMSFAGPDDKTFSVRVHPSPVQPELPVFLTAAGSVETFEAAGQLGAGLLTHLLGQSVEELTEKIQAYRSAWRAAGHPGNGTVALMLHTFVGDDDAKVKEIVRAPMKAYLKTSVNLIAKNAAAFPTFKKRADGSQPKLDFDALSPEDAEALLDFSFERYYETSGLFGSVERCIAFAERLIDVGVDDVACLIDFGVEPGLALRNLEHLNRVRAAFERKRSTSVLDQIESQDITHFQCTPSQARLLLSEERVEERLSQLTTMLVGGEALPAALAEKLQGAGVRQLYNMYGPTETTIWSTLHEVARGSSSVPIGLPIANTVACVLGLGNEPLPENVAGELAIAGPGVTRGYLNRQELTAERFVDVGYGIGRAYRTGDRVVRKHSGELEFLGRNDDQVKVRGYRIELGEIERALYGVPIVKEAAVIAWGDQAENRRLVAYVNLRDEVNDADQALRQALRTALPEFMLPSQFVYVSELPRTPNGKTDRKRLPSPDALVATAAPEIGPLTPTAPRITGDAGAAVDGAALQEAIAKIWQEILHVPAVSPDANFFDVGGHSLLAVEAHIRIKRLVSREFPITDLFRHATVRSLASHLANGSAPSSVPIVGQERAALRRQLRGARRSA